MCLCCPSKVCMFCVCVVLVVIAIGLVFGFGVFKDGFHKLHNQMHLCDAGGAACRYTRRRFAPPPF